MFQSVLALAREKHMLNGQTRGVDATTLEANAAMKSIVRKDTGEDWLAYLTKLMRDAGELKPEEAPSLEEILRFDKSRKNKQVFNEEGESTKSTRAAASPR